MLEWRENGLWLDDDYQLADVVRMGKGNVRLDLLGWDVFGVCDFKYSTVQAAKAAAEAWARYLVHSHETAARYACPHKISDEDIPF